MKFSVENVCLVITDRHIQWETHITSDFCMRENICFISTKDETRTKDLERVGDEHL